MTFTPRRSTMAPAIFLFVLAAMALFAPLSHAQQDEKDKKDFSQAERLLFMTNQIKDLRPPTTLRYSFRKSGSMEEAFEDKVSIALSKQQDGKCCASAGEFLTGARKLNLPELPEVEGNPVIMYFLERDVREMQRLTKGSQFHFRKRIRMAIYQAAKVREVPLAYRGKAIKGTEIEFSPYLDDPNRSRFEKLASKQYLFTLSDAVPGGVYGIRTQINEPQQSTALIVEELYAEGAEPSSPKKPTP